ncbi:hypothetical protein AM571_CH02468 [Rhizobium etli 8C-3]|uniref:DUF2950 family protein n=2 Tax=Rhizobium TaxID=379 RepID=A0A4R3QWE2_9HYPH|nr:MULTISPECIES: DUF2950 family protein [Rhizobium]APO75277.1 hypothetical protein AM571_CH02468 [Rhizobium etli 8C-3]TCU25629.1 DUF2950 family protein [Rhizobium azibense]TCU40084.1 DUF2950 family protein [Rhizobium azibense]
MRLRLRLIPLLLGTALSLAFAGPSATQMQTNLSEFAAGTPPSFDDPSAALQRFKAVLSNDDLDGLANLLGLDAAKLRSSKEAMISYGLIREGAARQLRLQAVGDRQIVEVGEVLWPLPFPLSQDKDGKWAFDTEVGLQEIVNRRIGENELATIQTMQEYVTAQREYASEDRDGDGVYEYAEKLISSPGKVDGLYWDPSVHGEESPASALIETAAFDRAKRGEGYYGYRYRILTRQGDNVLGGKQSYIVNGNMTGGFALLAWPVKYRVTGVQTFIINSVSVIYQRDLGPQTEDRAAAIKDFNPDSDWTVVSD